MRRLLYTCVIIADFTSVLDEITDYIRSSSSFATTLPPSR